MGSDLLWHTEYGAIHELRNKLRKACAFLTREQLEAIGCLEFYISQPIGISELMRLRVSPSDKPIVNGGQLK